jgi:hypothetical protein
MMTLRRHEEKILGTYAIEVEGLPTDARHILVLETPNELKGSLLVQMGQTLVFLPFVTDGVYEALGDLRREKKLLAQELSGHPLPWPTGPRHLLDFGKLRGFSWTRRKTS